MIDLEKGREEGTKKDEIKDKMKYSEGRKEGRYGRCEGRRAWVGVRKDGRG